MSLLLTYGVHVVYDIETVHTMSCFKMGYIIDYLMGALFIGFPVVMFGKAVCLVCQGLKLLALPVQY